MATIQPFCPICSDPFHAGELVFAKPQSDFVSGTPAGLPGVQSLKTLLEAGARQRPETTEGQENAYAGIRAALSNLLAGGRLWQEDEPGIYIYEVVQNGRKQTGVWALTALGDYRSGKIRVHEHTLAESLRRLQNYREHTGLEGSPVLLAYHPDKLINQLLTDAKRGPAKMAMGNAHGLHRIWKVAGAEQQELLINAFKNIGQVYLADGHHRLESARMLAAEQEQRGTPVYNSISSVYMATDELRIEPFDRLVVPDNQYDPVELLRLVGRRFHLMESTANRPVRPEGPCRMGMLLDGVWYHLLLRSNFCMDTACTDAERLQEHLLEPVFGITDPKTDSRLKYAGGEKALEEIGALFHAHPTAVAFTLCPLTVEQFVQAAEDGRRLPPKATCIAPKVPYGLLIHRHVQ